MPQIDTPFLLDILLGLVILLFVPFGIRRGVAKEALVSAGILFGAELAERFGATLGDQISARFGLEPRLGEFVASVAILFAATFVLGYGGGAALGNLRPGPLARLCGAILAAFNAGLLLNVLLTWIDTILGQSETVANGILARELVDDASRLMLAAAGVLLVLTVLGWFANALRSRRQPRHQADPAAWASSPRGHVQRSAAVDFDGKVEPGREPVGPSGRFEPEIDATSPLALGSLTRSGDANSGARSNGNHHLGAEDSLWRRPATASPRAHEETVWAPWTGADQTSAAGHREYGARRIGGHEASNQHDEHCSICGSVIGARDVFCPECGATL